MTGDALLGSTRDVLPLMVDLRRRLHRHPELGLDLPYTQSQVLEELDGLDLHIYVGKGLSSVIADLDTGRPGPTILLRGDMDALPMPEDSGVEFASEIEGRMHACGHDAHTSMLVGAAHVLASIREDLPGGRIRFMFQPGEEGSGGAAIMIEQDAVIDVDGAFALHVAPNVPTGILAWKQGSALASADEFEVTITGRGGHASTPHWAADPIPATAAIVTALQTMVTRGVDVFDPAVVSVTVLDAGTVNNVIPESARIAGTIRAVSERTRHKVWDDIRHTIDGVAAAHGCSAEVTIDEGYPVTINDPGFARWAAAVADLTFGPGHTFEMSAPIMGAEDFSYVLQKVPGAMFFLGACPPENPNPFEAPSSHSNLMVLHEDAMATGAAMHVAVATHFLAAGGDLTVPVG